MSVQFCGVLSNEPSFLKFYFENVSSSDKTKMDWDLSGGVELRK
jgi:hypothetical protein